MDKIIGISYELDAGNTRAGAKTWGKKINKVDLTQSNGYAFDGDWLDRGGIDSAKEGSFVLFGGRGGSWKNSSEYYALCQVVEGEKIDIRSGYQNYSGNNLKLLASSNTKIDSLKFISENQDLAHLAKSKYLPIFAKLRELKFV